MSRLVAVTLLALSIAPASAQFENVGTLSFPTSGSPAAQQHFLRGVAILHSFGWKQAIAEFQEAQKAQPDFAMAYWGETLCYNHPLQAEQDVKSPREVLARLGATPAERLAKAPTDREKGFLQAVEILWGPGDDWRARRVGYMNAMERLSQQYPNDDEVKTFFAVSLLSGGRALDDNTFRYEMRAGAIALDVFKRHPNHPGAPHYVIHSFDDPIHAPLALEAARAYAEIVPAVSHGVHMPTHIFIQHGMWNEVANQNVRAFNVARDLVQPGDTPRAVASTSGDMAHSGDWGQYGFLQLGDYAGARDRTMALEAALKQTKNPRLAGVVALTRARYIIETEEWAVQPIADDASAETIFANGMSAVHKGDKAVAAQMLEKLAAKAGAPATAAPAGPHADHGGAPAPAPAPGGATDAAKAPRIMHHELAAMIAMKGGQRDQAVSLLKEAVQIEDSMRPPNGAADPIKPAHELLGEALLEVGQPAEAAQAFDACLLRMPNRARSLMGAARAHAGAGHKDLAEARYKALKSFWKGAAIAAPTTEAR